MLTTLLKIYKTERDIIEEVCATTDTPVSFFTIEENEQMLLAEFNESDPGIMFRIGRMVEIRKEMINLRHFSV